MSKVLYANVIFSLRYAMLYLSRYQFYSWNDYDSKAT